MAATLEQERRESLPGLLVSFLESQSTGRLQSITWVEPDRLRFTAHFALAGGAIESRMFKYRSRGAKRLPPTEG